MKRLLLLNLLFVCLPSCINQSNDYQKLLDAEKNKNNPDSIAEILCDIDTPSQLSDRDLADYYRLFAYTQFYSASSQIDENIFQIPLKYYKTINDLERQYEIFMLGGTYWLQQKKYNKSFKYLSEGNQLADKNNNSKMLDRFCELLGGLHMEQKKYDVAIQYFKRRIKVNKDASADIFYDLALNYAYEGNLDSVRKYMNKSFKSSDNISTNLIVHRIRNYANILYEKHNYFESIEQLKQAEKYSDNSVFSNLYASLSLSYLAVEKIDSASLYLEKAKTLLKTKGNRDNINYISYKNNVMALEAIISSKQKKHISLFEMGFFNDSVVRENSSKQKVIKKQLGDKNRLETDILKLKLDRQRVYLIVIILIASFVLILFALISYNRKKVRRLVEIEEKTETLQILLDKAVKVQSNEVDDNFFKKILLQQLGIIKLIATNPTSQNQELLKQMTRISSEDINVESLLVWTDLYPIIDSIYNGFYTKVSKKYNNILLEKEIKLCCLLCAEFSTKEISVVTQQSVRTIYQRKTNIRQKLLINEKGDIVEFLMNLE